MESESDRTRELKMKLTAKLLPSLLGPREFLCLQKNCGDKKLLKSDLFANSKPWFLTTTLPTQLNPITSADHT